MSHTITVRLDADLADWLAETAKQAGVSQGKVIRDQLEKARAGSGRRRYMRWAGCVAGPKDLSMRKGFSKE